MHEVTHKMIGSNYHIIKSEVLHIALDMYWNSVPCTGVKVVMTRALLLTELMNHLLSALRLESSSQ